MMLIVHIALAITGVVLGTAAVIAPRVWRVRAVWSLIAGTVASGALVGLQMHASWQSVCMTGLAYAAGVGVLGLIAQYRLQKQTARLPRD